MARTYPLTGKLSLRPRQTLQRLLLAQGGHRLEERRADRGAGHGHTKRLETLGGAETHLLQHPPQHRFDVSRAPGVE